MKPPLPIFDSIAACAAGTGIPATRIKAAKRAGAPGFESNRVKLGPLLRWLFRKDAAASMDLAKAREAEADAKIREMTAGKLCGELVSLEEVALLFRESILPVRQRILALPAEACARCNPSDPQLAREALQRWVDESLPAIRKELPK